MTSQPKVSVITVCYNCCDTIEQTICNVLRQEYTALEYIVIDGGSTDGTREIVARYASRLDYWVSEPDEGIYDAMNKGIRAATGEWIIFRNAGDYFFSPNTICNVFAGYEDGGEDVIAGGIRHFTSRAYRDEYYVEPAGRLWSHASYLHPATFIRRSTHLRLPFLTDLRIAGDYYFFQRLRLEHGRCRVCRQIIALFDCESGVSSRHVGQGWQERLIVLQRLGAPRMFRLRTWLICVYKSVVGRLLGLISRHFPGFVLYRRRLTGGWVQQDVRQTLQNI